jgi:putative DNA methylase
MRFPETITRRNLPHWYMPGAAHFVTYRTHGSIPQSVLKELRAQKEALLRRKPPSNASVTQYRADVHKQLFAFYDQALDQGNTGQLRDPRIAAIIRSNLYHHNGTKYHLLAYCVMPNHVHALFQPIDWDVAAGGSPAGNSTGEPPVATLAVGEQLDSQSPLASIMHSLKSYTAHEANKVLRCSGPFW